MATLERLVYHSVATGRTDNLLTLATLLGQAQHNNARDELTGALVAHDNRFVQVLEGPAPAIDSLLRRLSVDPRHRGMVILGREAAERRIFAAWNMASTRITPEVLNLMDDLTADRSPSAEQAAMTLQAAVATA